MKYCWSLYYLHLNFGSTFGGNPLASAVAIAALEVIKDEGLIERYCICLNESLHGAFL